MRNCGERGWLRFAVRIKGELLGETQFILPKEILVLRGADLLPRLVVSLLSLGGEYGAHDAARRATSCECSKSSRAFSRMLTQLILLHLLHI